MDPIEKRKAWLLQRHGALGSSDAPVVMGVGKYKTRFELWEEKTNPPVLDEVPNFQQQYGINLEPVARAHYEIMGDIDMPATDLIFRDYSFLRASLDGYDQASKRILEIKCPGKDDHATAVSGKVPEHYVWQLVHQMMVADADSVDYFSYFEGAAVIVKFDRDLEMEARLLKELLLFWDLVQVKQAPEFCGADFKLVKFKGAADLFRAWHTAFNEKDEPTRKSVEEKIAAQIKGPRLHCQGVRVFKRESGYEFQLHE